MYGLMGRTLRVDLTSRTHDLVDNDASFCRRYLGGSLLAARLFEEHLAQTAIGSPFSAQNPLVFATGPLAGTSICGAPRVNLFTLSPETTGTYLSQAGGEFGPCMKRAGFDALVITGRSPSPVHLRISSRGGELTCAFEDATELWGKSCFEVHELLGDSLGRKHQLACIGPGGESRVACANVMFEVDHFAGRGGFGAVMGSKNLKVISVGGDQTPVLHNRKRAFELNKRGVPRMKETSPTGFMGVLRELGTFGLTALNQDSGNLPTENFSRAVSDVAEFDEALDHPRAKEQLVGKSNPCKACYVSCKKQTRTDSVHADKHALVEYESLAMLGPNLGLDRDLDASLRACELCNAMGLDTISMGAALSWLMDCARHGVAVEGDLELWLRFGDGESVCRLIEDVAHRRGGLGQLLADGLLKAVETLGAATRPYLRAARGVGLPAHMPRKKPGVGFGYLHGPNPGDHMKLEHDWIASDPDMLKAFGLDVRSEPGALDKGKVEVARKTQIYYSMVDVLSECMFVFGPGNLFTFEEIAGLVEAATGFGLTFADLMRLGERSVQLQRKLYVATGGKDEVFLEYLAKAIPAGPSKGARITESDFAAARAHYYALWGWGAEDREAEVGAEVGGG